VARKGPKPVTPNVDAIRALPAVVGFLAGALTTYAFSGALWRDGLFLSWSIATGLLAAVSAELLWGAIRDFRSMSQALESPPSWSRGVWLSAVGFILCGVGIFIARPIILEGRRDVPLEGLEGRIAFIYILVGASGAAQLGLLILARRRLTELRQLSNSTAARSWDGWLREMMKVRTQFFKSFIAFGVLVIAVTLSTAAYERVLSATTGTQLEPGSSIGFGILVALVLAAFVLPNHVSYVRASQNFIDMAFPLPGDPSSWKEWRENQRSLAAVLGVGLTAANMTAAVFAVISPLLGSLLSRIVEAG
jgi:hypothetical protein